VVVEDLFVGCRFFFVEVEEVEVERGDRSIAKWFFLEIDLSIGHIFNSLSFFFTFRQMISPSETSRRAIEPVSVAATSRALDAKAGEDEEGEMELDDDRRTNRAWEIDPRFFLLQSICSACSRVSAETDETEAKRRQEHKKKKKKKSEESRSLEGRERRRIEIIMPLLRLPPLIFFVV